MSTRVKSHIPIDVTRIPLRLSDEFPMRAVVARTEKQGEPDYDMHYPVELGVILSGRMRRIWRTCEVELGPGEVWYCGIWERHGWQVIHAPCEHLVLAILPEALIYPGLPMVSAQDLLAPFRVDPEKRPKPTSELRQQILGIAQWIAESIEPSSDDGTGPTRPLLVGPQENKLWIRMLVCELLCRLQQKWAHEQQTRIHPADAFEALVSAIELAFRSRELITTKNGAQAAGLKVNSFSRAFKELTGISFAKFALRHRLSRATGQLLRTQDTIEKVAREWGFTDGSHFHHVFMQHYGFSPSRYREMRSSHNEG